MIVYKHHIAATFEDKGIQAHNNGAGIGATVFLSFAPMIECLKADGRQWYIAIINVKASELQLHNDGVTATIKVNRTSRQGFLPLLM